MHNPSAVYWGLRSPGSTSAESSFPWRSATNCQQSGFIHGGVLSYLADNAITYACGLGLGADIVTSGYTIEYVAPARDGARLVADASLVSAGRTKALGRCEISVEDHDGTATLVAVAQGTSMVRRSGT